MTTSLTRLTLAALAMGLCALPAMSQDMARQASAQKNADLAMVAKTKADTLAANKDVKACDSYAESGAYFEKAVADYKLFLATVPASNPGGNNPSTHPVAVELERRKTLTRATATACFAALEKARLAAKPPEPVSPPKSTIPITDEDAKAWQLKEIRETLTTIESEEISGDVYVSLEKDDAAVKDYAKALAQFTSGLKGTFNALDGHWLETKVPAEAARNKVVKDYVDAAFVRIKGKFNAACATRDANVAKYGGTAPRLDACNDFQDRLETVTPAILDARYAAIKAQQEKAKTFMTQAGAKQDAIKARLASDPASPLDVTQVLETYQAGADALTKTKALIKILDVYIYAEGSNALWYDLKLRTDAIVFMDRDVRVGYRDTCKLWTEWSAKQTVKPERQKLCR